MMNVLNSSRFSCLPDGILFDTDNTLYPYEPAKNAAELAIKNKLQQTMTIPPKRVQEMYLEARKQVKKNLEGTASSHSRLIYFQRMLELMGLGSQVLLALDLEQTYWRAFLANAILFPGVKDLLEELRLKRVKSAIVTDLTAQIQFRKMVYFGLEEYFDYIVTSEEAGMDKPHPKPFELALGKMGLNTSNNVWMVGDNIQNDILGSQQAIGAAALLKDDGVNTRDPLSSRADLIFSDFKSLSKLVASL